MIVGVPKEIKNKEHRVSMVPTGVKAFKSAGHQILVQNGAGREAGIPDEEYLKAGATLVETADEIYLRSDLLMKVKEPLPEEYALLREGQILFTYLHLAPDKKLTQALIESGVVAIGYETIQIEDGTLPLLAPMSAIAGRLATQIGATYLQHDYGGKGILLGGITGVERGNVVILGGGVVGMNAAKMAVGLGAKVTLLETNTVRLSYLSDIFGNDVTLLHSNDALIEKSVIDADLLIGAVLVPGAKAPKLVSRSMISEMQPGSVVIDVAVDQGGAVETSRPTTHEDPTFLVDGIIHYAVPNMPGAVPRTSTYALTNATLNYGLILANLGWKEAAIQNKAIRKGINICNGKVVYQPIAEAQGLPTEPLPI